MVLLRELLVLINDKASLSDPLIFEPELQQLIQKCELLQNLNMKKMPSKDFLSASPKRLKNQISSTGKKLGRKSVRFPEGF
jgi:hypothetical protein